jgi:hypothetical protein
MGKDNSILEKNFIEFGKQLTVIINREQDIITKGTEEEKSNIIGEHLNLVNNFVKDNNLCLLELDTAWVEKSERRRRFHKRNDIFGQSFKNLTDKEFLEKFNKGKKDTLYIYSTFWGVRLIQLL